ncbi:anti-sigma-I factor RsgI family protein [Romboutsia lituseburensis]|uniref:Anti-sigma factor RsgI-like middle domain-containing protein n=1 Tax=Romboutsia lituseburensis DSM 797 TaxID=1121325 RepID=A0A1G9S3R9_9FIRM|nr:hypothetical protein [Romboutsia lituseburensis]CEH32923.1 Hypothetical protein RLITU_0313 [Romboutsia lituseburensis]SDM30143.1 hypothetical protein SAMN04515677_10879 [Romboutsia lituseburensis DSM 797]
MEDNILKILDDLDLEEVSLLLDQDFSMPIDNKIKNRIKSSVITKAGFDLIPSKKSYLNKIKDTIKSNLVRNKIAFACSLSILFLGFGTYTYIKLPVAYVSLDINPSIELSVNRFNNVVSTSALNKDGQILLNDINSDDKSVYSIVNGIIDSAIKEKYISNNKPTAIAVASISNDYELRNSLKNDLKNSINNHLSKKSIDGTIYSYDEDLSKRDASQKMDISVGKMNLIEELISFDESITVDDYKNKSVVDIDDKILEFKDNTKDSDKTSDDSTKNINSGNLSKTKEENISINNNSFVNTNSRNKPTNSNNNNTSSGNNSNNSNGDSSKNKPSDNNNNSSSSSSNSNNSNGDSSKNKPSDNDNSSSSSSNNSNNSNGDSSSNNRPGNSGNAPGHNKPNYNGNHHNHNRPNNNNGNHYGHDKNNNGHHHDDDDERGNNYHEYNKYYDDDKYNNDDY